MPVTAAGGAPGSWARPSRFGRRFLWFRWPGADLAELSAVIRVADCTCSLTSGVPRGAQACTHARGPSTGSTQEAGLACSPVVIGHPARTRVSPVTECGQESNDRWCFVQVVVINDGFDQLARVGLREQMSAYHGTILAPLGVESYGKITSSPVPQGWAVTKTVGVKIPGGAPAGPLTVEIGEGEQKVTWEGQVP